MQPTPTRYLRRRITRFSVQSMCGLIGPTGRDVATTLVLYAVLCSNVDHLPYGSPEAVIAAEGSDKGDELRRPISINALASSLALPFETVRRKVHELEVTGLCRRCAGGMIVPSRVAAGPVVSSSLLGIRLELDHAITRMGRAGFDLDNFTSQLDGDLSDHRIGGSNSPLLEARILLVAMLRVMEHWRGAPGGVLGAYLLIGIIDANTNHFDDGDPNPPVFAFLETPPPDAVRRPVTVASLARTLALSDSTVRRWVSTFVEQGLVRETGRGLIVPTEVIESGIILGVSQSVAANVGRVFVELRRLGMNLDRREAA